MYKHTLNANPEVLMALIGITRFAGQTPRLATRLLAPEQASKAVNCKLWSGELRPFRRMVRTDAVDAGKAPLTMHRMQDGNWLFFATDADVVRAPIPGDRHERTCVTGLGPPRFTDNRLASANVHDGRPSTFAMLGVPAPDTAPVARVNRKGSGALESRAYVYTFVNQYGEEGPPSPPSRTLDVAVDASVLLGGMQTAPESSQGLATAITARRIYRTRTAGADYAAFSLVREIDARLTSFVDNKPTADLGVELPSVDWYPPPPDMQGLLALPNGVMAGFRNNEICFSEPLAPHAWPPQYRLVTDHPVVALGAYDTTIVAATTANPYLITGATPASMSMSKLPGRQACVSKRGMVSTEAGVIYPTPDGLYLIGPKAGVLVTRDLFTRDEWQAYSPETMHAVVHDGRLFLFYGDGGPGSGGLILDRAEPSAGLTRLDVYAWAAFSDTGRDSLYLAVDQDQGPWVMRWEGGGESIPFIWRSKTFVTEHPQNLAVAKVVADFPKRLDPSAQSDLQAERQQAIDANAALIMDGGPLGGALGGHAVAALTVNACGLRQVPAPYEEPPGLTFRLKGDGALRHQQQVFGPESFRLPAGYTAREWQVELCANFAVREIKLAPSAEELGG